MINSAIIKLAKLTKASFVYRGISDKLLPRRLHDKDDIDVRGGVEFGFLSCSTKKAEALRYAKIGQTGKPILFEMKMGMIDRGADFEWLSQVRMPCACHLYAMCMPCARPYAAMCMP